MKAEVFPEKQAQEVVTENMRVYGQAVVADRAIPDLRDGLKPVQRRILYTMYDMGMHSKGGLSKCAKTVGAVIGTRHPHGDVSCFLAMTNMMHPPLRLIEGGGNIGDHNSPPAAMRYLEAKLDKNADNFLFDPRYMPLMQHVPNYDGTAKDPICLPALLPLYLMLEQQGIAVGIASRIPAFTLHSIVRVLIEAIKNKGFTDKICQGLEFTTFGGGVCTAPKEDRKALYNSPQSRLEWKCKYKAVSDKIVHITGIAPDWNYESKRERLLAIDGVRAVLDRTNRKGLLIEIQCKSYEAIKDKLDALLTTNISYNLYSVVRTPNPEATSEDGCDTKVKQDSVIGMLTDWLAWRTQLEVAMWGHQQKLLEDSLHRTNLVLTVIQNFDKILVLMKNRKLSKEYRVEKLAKMLKITVEDSKTVWAMSLGSFDASSEDGLQTKKKQILKDIAQAKSNKERPKGMVLKSLQAIESALPPF